MENLFTKRKKKIKQYHIDRGVSTPDAGKIDIPDNLFSLCANCGGSMVYEEFQASGYVCPLCGHYTNLTASERIAQITDKNSFKVIDANLENTHPDFLGYAEKLKSYQEKTSLKDAIVCGVGKIDGQKVALGVMESHFMMGSMGFVVGEKITRLVEKAKKLNIPLIIFCCSGGARMQEGIISLMQMAKTSAALASFKNLYISVLTHPTTGGVSASFAFLGDIIVAEPKALIGFAGRRVIENTINEELPENFQKSEFLLEKGFLDMIVERKNMKANLSKLIRFHKGGNHGTT